MRTINMTVTGDLVEVDGAVVGVQGSGNADTIRLTLDAAWDGWAKTATWWDAHGAESVSQTVTAALLEDVAVNTRCYLLPVPPEALRYGGQCTLVLDGYKDYARARTVRQEFDVAWAPARAAVSGSVTTPTDMEQMQAQVDAVLSQLQTVVSGEAARVAAENGRVTTEEERETAETRRETAENGRGAAEAGRETAEEGRVAAESGRVTAEAGRVTTEGARVSAEAARVSAEQARAAAEAERQASIVGQVATATQAAESAQGAKTAVLDAKEDVLCAQAAIHARRRVRIGTATDVELLMPGDELIIVDDSSVVSVTDYQDLLLEAQKAAAGTTNNLDTLAVLSVVNATNLRRTADGLLWTTDTLANFREKLTAFAAAAVAGGYVTTDGQCIATWAQAQAWLLEGALFSPIDAEAKDYTWRKAAPKTEYDAVKERLASIEAQLGQGAGTINTLITGGTR